MGKKSRSGPGTNIPAISVADPHHIDADPDPSFQIKAQNLKKVLKSAYHSGADPDPAYHCDADPSYLSI
jgi:hypothetical protein